MKFRFGFVSNSSASSFMVIRKDFMDNKVYLSKKDESILKKFGFKKVSCYYADQVDYEIAHQKRTGEKPKEYQFGYSVSCNQDDVILFLLQNKISFEAVCEYDHYHVIYKSGAKDFLVIQNYGQQASMSNWRADKNYKSIFEKGFHGIMEWNTERVKRVNVKQWVKREEKWAKKFQENEDKVTLAILSKKVKNEEK